jgi:hypothetical protein
MVRPLVGTGHDDANVLLHSQWREKIGRINDAKDAQHITWFEAAKADRDGTAALLQGICLAPRVTGKGAAADLLAGQHFNISDN